MLANNLELNYSFDGKCKVTVTLTGKPPQDIQDLRGIVEPLEVSIKKYRKKRSLDANAYLWILCQKIAEKLNSSKEEIYREVIRKVGKFEITAIKDSAVEMWIKNWNSGGLGWHSEVLRESKLEGYSTLINYYGSSIYLTSEFSLLLTEVIIECKAQGIETITPSELAQMMSHRDKNNVKHKG